MKSFHQPLFITCSKSYKYIQRYFTNFHFFICTSHDFFNLQLIMYYLPRITSFPHKSAT